MGKLFGGKAFKATSELKGYHFPNLQVYVTVDEGTVYFTYRHVFKNPQDVHESLATFASKFVDGSAELTRTQQDRLLHVLRELEAGG